MGNAWSGGREDVKTCDLGRSCSVTPEECVLPLLLAPFVALLERWEVIWARRMAGVAGRRARVRRSI